MQNSTKQKENFFNLTNIFLLAYLVIDLLPTFEGKFSLTAIQYLYINIVNICCLVYFFKNKTVFDKFISTFVLKTVAFVYLLYLFLCLFSFFGTANFSLSIVSFSKILVFSIVGINLFFLLQNCHNKLKALLIVIAIITFLQCFFALNNFTHDLNSNNYNLALFKFTANTGNVNLFGASLIVKIPFLILGIITFDKVKKMLFSIVLLMAFISVYLTSSRACYISLAFSLLLFLVYNFSTKNKLKTNFKTSLFVIIPFFLGIFISNLTLKKVTNSLRTKDVVSRTIQIADTTDSSRNIRLKFWGNAFEMAKDNPIFGVGLGNYVIESIPYERDFSNDSKLSTNAHNDFLEITAETGFLNGLVYLLLFAVIGFFNIKNYFKTKNQESKQNSVALIILAFVYFIDAFFNFPLYKPSTQIYFMLLLVLTILNHKNDSKLTSISKFNQKIGLLGTVSLVSLYFMLANFQASILDYANKKILFFKEHLSSEFVTKNMPTFPNVSYNSEPYSQLLAVAYYNENNFEKALPLFEKAHQINPYLGHSDWYRYKIFQHKKNKDSAFFYAKRAFEARPRNCDYFLDYTNAAVEKKDTATIFAIHKEYTSRRNNSGIWRYTAFSLANCNYNYINLMKFVDKGLLIFPADTLLLNQKEIFKKDKSKINRSKDAIENFNFYLKNATKYSEAGNFIKGIEFYKKAIALQPSEAVLYQNLGLCYFKLNQVQPALTNLLKSLSFNILQDGKSEYLIGVCYLYLKDLNKSCNYFQLSKSKNNLDANAMIEKYCSK